MFLVLVCVYVLLLSRSSAFLDLPLVRSRAGRRWDFVVSGGAKAEKVGITWTTARHSVLYTSGFLPPNLQKLPLAAAESLLLTNKKIVLAKDDYSL